MAAATALAILGAGSSLLGGLFGSKAAKSAATTQSDAAKAAAAQITDTAKTVNPYITNAATKAGAGVVDAAKTAGTGVVDAAKAAGTGVADATGKAVSGVQGAVTGANDLLNPYISSGAGATSKLGDLADEKFKFSQDDPSFQFRLQEGQKALERSAAARGGAMGGGAMKAITGYGQSMASTEYAAAFDRFNKGRTTSAGIYSDIAGRGLSAAGGAGKNLLEGGEYAGNAFRDSSKYIGDADIGAAKYAGDTGFAGSQYAGSADMHAADLTSANTLAAAGKSGDYLTSAAAAKAAGQVGAANAWTGALSGVAGAANSFGQGLMLKDLLNPGIPRKSGGAPWPSDVPTATDLVLGRKY
jgi:hypothetical protein